MNHTVTGFRPQPPAADATDLPGFPALTADTPLLPCRATGDTTSAAAAVLNTAFVVSATPTTVPGGGPALLIRFRDGTEVSVRGTADQVFPGV